VRVPYSGCIAYNYVLLSCGIIYTISPFVLVNHVTHPNTRMHLHTHTGTKPDSPNQRELNSQSMKNLQLEKIESRNKVDIFENAFRKIKEATGVSE
jgi:hypothetical protein